MNLPENSARESPYTSSSFCFRNVISLLGGLAHLGTFCSGHFMSRPALTHDDLIRKALLVVEEACVDGRVR